MIKEYKEFLQKAMNSNTLIGLDTVEYPGLRLMNILTLGRETFVANVICAKDLKTYLYRVMLPYTAIQSVIYYPATWESLFGDDDLESEIEYED